ncbi:MAG TPA: CHASE4 domain-containing protein [Sphingomonas sp.]|nr:CHASE4 domain-containing protein [Sphingomonas sp.]
MIRRGASAPVSLGAKLVLVLTAVGLAGALGITLLLASVITPSFNGLERRSIGTFVDRADAALAAYAARVDRAVRFYGDSSETYRYLAAPDALFERETLSPRSMANHDIQGMAFVSPRRTIHLARWLDPATYRARDDLRAAFMAMIRRTDLAATVGARSSATFYARLGNEIAAIGVARVRASDGTGTPRGYVVMARTIDSRQIADLLQLDAKIALAAPGDQPTAATTRASIALAVPIRGADARPLATIRFAIPRDVSLLGRRMLLLAVAGSTLLLLLILMVLRRMIGLVVLRPLRRVERHMQHVRASGSLGPLEDDGRRDEFGSLGRSFNAMLRQLQDLREQIEVQSFALGRSESAVAVMHNVRNALSPISTILSQGIAQAPPVDRQLVDRALGELQQEGVAPDRRARLATFVEAAVSAETTAREAMRRELQIGRGAMAHVLEIIGQQQAQAHERPLLEPCDISEIVAHNATIARYSHDVSIAFSFPGEPHRVLANRLILSQVVGNLIGNAAEAIAASGRDSGMIAVTVSAGPDMTIVAIQDDGEGFSADAAPALFQRGFSTREQKSGGLGLHWCANSMNAMQGSLAVTSDGVGLGATATLTLRSPPRADGLRIAA